MKKINVHKLALISLLTALAIVIAIAESFIPSIGIPGVKLGLANIVILVILYELGIVEAILVDLLRVFIVGLMRGNIVSMGFVMSITGATLSLSVMIIFYLLTKKFSIVGVSVIDSIFHVTGQVVVAMLFLESRYVLYYLPFIALSAIIAGIFVGIVARLIIKTGMIFLRCITVGLFT
jgi:heptaprenyl diphosphate synthase